MRVSLAIYSKSKNLCHVPVAAVPSVQVCPAVPLIPLPLMPPPLTHQPQIHSSSVLRHRPQLKTASANWGRHSSPHVIIIITQASTHHHWDKIIPNSFIYDNFENWLSLLLQPISIRNRFFLFIFVHIRRVLFFIFCMSTWAGYE